MTLKYDKDFALKCKAGFDLAAWSTNGNIFRPANFTGVHIGAGDFSNFYGARCAAGIAGTVEINFTGPAQFISANGLTPTAVSGNTITWNIADFGMVNSSDFNITVQTNTLAQLGSQVCFTITVTPATAGDYNLNNNTLTHCFTVVGSYDPNDKQVYPSSHIDTLQEWLTCTVRFQNTGTAEAQHVYIDDTLDANLDASTFQLLSYSHDPIVQIQGNAVRFNFPNINLPDSNANEPASHGYVQYKVKLMENLPVGTQVKNTAYIYFDFNSPVVTNTVSNIIVDIPDTISGLIFTEFSTPIPNVNVSLFGTEDKITTTLTDGFYLFETAPNGSFSLTLSKNNDADPTLGITTLDILKMQRHILGLEVINSPFKLLAADVNNSSSITTLDLVLTRALILGRNSSFPGNQLWKFVRSDFVFDPQTPFVYDNSRSYTSISESQFNQNFIGMKLGDVDNSWDQNIFKTGAVGEVEFGINDHIVDPEDEVVIPITVKNFTSVTGYQFSLKWDPGVLKFLETENKGTAAHFGTGKTAEGLLMVSWNSANTHAIGLNDDDIVFELKFKIVGQNGTRTQIEIVSKPTIAEAYDEDLQLLQIAATNGSVKVGSDITTVPFFEKTHFDLSIQPNPFTNSANIIFTIPQDAHVQIVIYDLFGKQVKKIESAFAAGEHKMEWKNDDAGNAIAEGLYHVRMISGDLSKAVRAVMVK